MEISQLIQNIIKDNSLNQTSFAKSIGTTQAQVSDWIAKKSKPSYDNLHNIGEIYNINANEILDIQINKKIKFIDLFSGMGGIRIGFEQACKDLGLEAECVLTSEIKESAIQTLQQNFNNENIIGDIREIKASTIPDFDFLLGGFPCQAFSTAGKGLGFLDTRGTLFFEVERILREKSPAGFLLENVEGLITHDKEKSTDKIGRTFLTILKSLENLGYKISWQLVDSQYYGVAQSRKRVYIVGTKTSQIPLILDKEKAITFSDIKESNLPCINSHFTKCLLSHYKPSELYGKAIKDKRGGDTNIHSWDIGLKGELSKEQIFLLNQLFKERRKKHWAEDIGIDWMDGMPLTIEQIKTFNHSPNLTSILDDMVNKGYLVKEHPKMKVKKIISGKETEIREQDTSKEKGYNIVAGKLSFEFTKILDDNSIAPTLVAMDASKLGVVDGNGIRHLSIREGLRLFGYPEWYSLKHFDNKKDMPKAFDLLGNTVIIPVIKKVAMCLLANYKKRG